MKTTNQVQQKVNKSKQNSENNEPSATKLSFINIIIIVQFITGSLD